MAEEKSVKNYSAYLKKIVMDSFRDYWDGSKFTGSLGPVSESTFVDYWTLRRRSMNLFKTNIYARGVIRRLVWNEINTGLVVTPTPKASVLFPKEALEREDEAVEWGENRVSVRAVRFDSGGVRLGEEGVVRFFPGEGAA